MSDIGPQMEELPDPMADTPLTSKAGVKARKTKAGLAEDDRRATLRGLLSLKPGRRWLFWLMAQCGRDVLPLQYPANGQPVDTHATTFNIGKASIGNLLVAECLAASPDDYLKMIRESKEPVTNG